MRVPTCRTRMLPALASWPANIFTPRRWPWLSRPLRLLPCPFLCAMARRSRLDADHPHRGEHLTMAAVPAVVLAPLLFEHQDLLFLALLQHLSSDACPAHQRAAHLNRTIVSGHEYVGEGDFGAGFA